MLTEEVGLVNNVVDLIHYCQAGLALLLKLGKLDALS